jgi:hypothetical protein
MNPSSLEFFSFFLLGILGLYEECHCWWNWKGNCAKCSALVKMTKGVFCANFCKPQGSWPACRKAWHASCYECLSQGKFPIKRIKDKEGNKCYKHKKRVHRVNHGVWGAHGSIHFQCEHCWLINLEEYSPVEGLDDAYVMLIRQANLGAMGGRAVATIEAHTAAIQQGVNNCQLFRKTPFIPPQGPIPIGNSIGMWLVVKLLFHSLTAVPRINGAKHILFDLMRKPRSTFSSAWESSPIPAKNCTSHRELHFTCECWNL